MTVGYLDTNILIDYFNGREDAKTAMARYTDLKLPAMTYIEFMAGVKTQEQEMAAIKVIDALFEIVHTDDEICMEAARLRRGSRTKLPDLLIYATARVHGGVLVTRNTKDFSPHLDDIDVPYAA